MQYGLVELGNLGLRLQQDRGGNYIGILPPATIANTFTLTLPGSLPDSTKMMVVDTAGNIIFQAIPSGGGGGAGTVTSISLSLPTDVFNVNPATITDSGTFAVTFDNQNANTFFAGATTGGATTPGFRSLVYADVSAFVGTTANTIAAGNDARLHNQNTDTGTTQTSFQLDAGNAGARLKHSGGAIQIRNSADDANAPLICSDLTLSGNLTVQGTTTTVNSETLTIDDNIIVLNNNVSTGTPTENGGVEVRRGASTSATILWNETSQRWEAGLVGATQALVRRFETTFTSSNLVGGVLTVTHNLGRRVVPVTIADQNFEKIGEPDKITYSSATQLTIDFTSLSAFIGANTWTISVG